MNLSKKITNRLRQPYPLILEFSKTFPVIVGISLFVPIFLFVFKPFDLTDADLQNRPLFFAGFGAVTFIILAFNVYVLSRLFPNLFDEDRWTVGREMLWILWLVFSGVSGAAVFEFIQPDCPFTFPQLVNGYLKGFLISIIPVAMIVLLAHTSFLRNRLQRAEVINQKLARPKGERLAQPIKLFSENETDAVSLLPEDLIAIQSSDNYSTVFWEEKGQIKKQLLRSSLKRLEMQIAISTVVRCHRSFIVNLKRVQSVSGNANGYRLSLKAFPEPVPVARSYGKTVLSLLETMAD